MKYIRAKHKEFDISRKSHNALGFFCPHIGKYYNVVVVWWKGCRPAILNGHTEERWTKKLKKQWERIMKGESGIWLI